MNKHPRPYILAETNWKSIQANTYDIAILPWGATEAHNYHLPYATDNYQVDHVAQLSAEKAWNQGAKVIVLPTIPFGVNTGQLDVPFCMNLNPSTQLAILKDVCDVLVRHNINKLIILNGHGANNFIAMIREMAGIHSNLFITVVNWFQAVSRDGIFELPGDHADEMETSLMMHLFPNLVLPLNEAGDGATKKFNLTGINEGWAWAQRPWTMVTKDTGSGDPQKATVEKGELFISKCVDKIAEFCRELSGKSIKDLIQ
jgi:creatinine amidohydrolase